MDNKISVDLVGAGLLNVEQACEWTGLSRAKLYQLMEKGELPFVKIGRARRIPKRALIEFAAANLRGGWALETHLEEDRD